MSVSEKCQQCGEINLWLAVRSAWILCLIGSGVVVLAGLAGCGGSAAAEQAAAQRLKDAGAIVLSQNGKVYLCTFSRMPLSNELAADIGALFNLKNLDFTAAELTDEQIQIAVSPLDLVSIVLSETAVTDEGLKTLSGSSRIDAIFLRDTGIGDQGLKNLSGLDSLLELDLTNSKITNEGLAHLAGLSKLKRLSLDGTSVDDAGVEHLKKLKSLGRLTLAGTAVTAEGASELGKAVPGLMVER